MATPQLRFKEFDGDWKSNEIGKFLIEYKEKVPSSTEIEIYSSSRDGLKPQKEYFENRELQNFGEYGVVPPKYFTYRHMSDDTTFKFNINLVGKKIVVSKEYPVFTTNEYMDSAFLLLKLNESNDFKKFAIEQKKGGTRTRLYFKALCTWETLLPDLKEQTKIASFLSVVDEKISQLTKKHELLSQYKQGMMQKLFSRQIRFKADDGSEFGEWEEKLIGDIADIKRGASPRPITDPKWFDEKSNVGWVRISDVSKSKKILKKTEQYLSKAGIDKSRFIAKGNIIMSICATIGKPVYTGFDVCIHDGFVVFSDLQAKHEYTYYYLEYIEKNWYQYGQPGTQVNLNSEIVANESFPFPCLEEQTKIANFLSAIDQKIEVVAQQIEQAKQWKKGLLQQMFV